MFNGGLIYIVLKSYMTFKFSRVHRIKHIKLSVWRYKLYDNIISKRCENVFHDKHIQYNLIWSNLLDLQP